RSFPVAWLTPLAPRLTDVVPQANNWLVAAVMLEAEHPHAGRVAEEEPPGCRRQAEPARRDRPDDVAAGERQHVAGEAVDPGDDAVGPTGDVFGRFSLGAAIAVEFPAGPLLQDVAGQLSLVAAVIPLDQVGIDFCAGPPHPTLSPSGWGRG